MYSCAAGGKKKKKLVCKKLHKRNVIGIKQAPEASLHQRPVAFPQYFLVLVNNMGCGVRHLDLRAAFATYYQVVVDFLGKLFNLCEW